MQSKSLSNLVILIVPLVLIFMLHWQTKKRLERLETQMISATGTNALRLMCNSLNGRLEATGRCTLPLNPNMAPPAAAGRGPKKGNEVTRNYLALDAEVIGSGFEIVGVKSRRCGDTTGMATCEEDRLSCGNSFKILRRVIYSQSASRQLRNFFVCLR